MLELDRVILTPAQGRAVLAAAEAPAASAVLHLLLAAGLDGLEVARHRPGDWEPEAGVLTVRGHGIRRVRVARCVAAALDACGPDGLALCGSQVRRAQRIVHAVRSAVADANVVANAGVLTRTARAVAYEDGTTMTALAAYFGLAGGRELAGEGEEPYDYGIPAVLQEVLAPIG